MKIALSDPHASTPSSERIDRSGRQPGDLEDRDWARVFRGLKILAIGHFEVPALQLDLLGRAFEQEGAVVRRATFSRGKLGKIRQLLSALIRDSRWADVIVNQCHGHLNVYQGLAVAAAARLARRPFVLLYYGGTLESEFAKAPWAYRTLFRSADAIVVASGFLGGVIGKIGFDTVEIRHIVFPDAWRSRVRSAVEPRLLSVRGFHPMYNPMMVLRAFARVHAERPDATLTMVGRGRLRNEVEEEARKAQLPVTFLTEVADLTGIFESHDMFLNASDFDNQPVCLIESMLTGMPIVTSDAGGIPYMMKNGEAGYLVPRGDDEGMAKAALRLLEDPSTVEAMSNRGMQLARAYQWSELGPQWADLLGSVTEGKR
jgi:glycosyltransferase involved in cell wall biosynthesis